MILDKIVVEKKKTLELRKKNNPINLVKEVANRILLDEKEKAERSIEEGLKNNILLQKGKLSVIGEFKKASPSKGVIVEDFNIEKILKLYKELDIDAYSILTEESFFLGKDEYLKKVRSLSNKPLLRKDFIIDFYQIYEAKVLGATSVLLIAAVLGDKLGEFYNECKKYNIEPLIETHNREELELALATGGKIIGINNRDLTTFKTTLDTTKELIKYVPKDRIIVSESGMKNIEDLKRVYSYGADAVLVGEMFMRNMDNEEFIKEFKNFKKSINS